MDRSKNLILKKGVDITGDVQCCTYNPVTQKYDITFNKNGKIYPHSPDSIEWVRESTALNPSLVQIMHGERTFDRVEAIYIFLSTVEHWHICFTNGSRKTYNRWDLQVTYSCLDEKEAKNCISYLQGLASVNELKGDDGKVLLQEQYEKLHFVGNDTVMAAYIHPQKYKIEVFPKSDLIFPFGGNASQFKAVRNALTSQISVIQGPPGTGKTQTILNIIANLLIMGKSVQIVSNNNSATRNVLEKLAAPQYNMGFLAAPLGNRDNKTKFIQNQTGRYPDLSGWRLDTHSQFKLREKIAAHTQALSVSFALQEQLSQARLEFDALGMEMKHFERYCSETGFVFPGKKPKKNMDSKTIMQLWQECCVFSEKNQLLLLWFKIKTALMYGIAEWRFYKNSLPVLITLFQKLFYEKKAQELNDEITALEKRLQIIDAKRKMDELTGWSMDYLRARLFERYGDRTERRVFSRDELWQRAGTGEVVKEYPIILSTTFSSCSSLKGVTYDYLIMDEASQVDIAAGALALSCAKNAVIVGDLKQLPNVVTDDMKARCDAIFDSYKLPQGYSFSENSFLKSICEVLSDVPQTLLREHYRCHPKIIGFCNQKFYHNELLIMTEDHGEPDTLAVFKTVSGDHRRSHTNQRQIDVTLKEALPLLSGINPEDIGIIAPYKHQIHAMKGQLNTDGIEVDTVHKFQGREKDIIVLTTVDDVVTDFSDDPFLLNVAISRAKKRLVLVVSGNEQPADSNIGDLISYIEYNNFQIVQSEIYSVFDLLYHQYTDARIAFLKRHPRVSAYDSENVMYGAIVDMLDRRKSLPLTVICHQQLNMLFRDTERLNADEYHYIVHPAAHIDFLIYNRISKKPVLAIEVDGFHYHKAGTKQYKRDRMKDHILELYGIPLLRFPTNGSGEQAKIEQFLDDYARLTRISRK